MAPSDELGVGEGTSRHESIVDTTRGSSLSDDKLSDSVSEAREVVMFVTALEKLPETLR